MIKVKLSCPPQNWNFKKYFPNDVFEWGDFKFFLNQNIKECDYWFILGNIVDDIESVAVPSNNVIFNIQENPEIIKYSQNFLNQFHYVTSYILDINHPNYIKTGPVFPWFIERDFNQCMNFNSHKTKKLSIITSDKKMTINHIKRLNFYKKLNQYFGDEIDIYGAGFSGFVNEKKTTLDPYMFSVVVENNKLPNYFTEKVADCFLSHTFPLYHGCTNFNEYFDDNSFQIIDINNFNHSASVIKKILDDDDFYQSRLNSIIKSKSKYLNEFSIVASIVKIINEIKALETNKICSIENVKIIKSKPSPFIKRIQNKIIVKAYDLLH